ncbi:MAG: hypothetical protein LUD29_00525, partial [Clostridia bacterium]|nr:hypothetical protein [Clostridia bacterium]
MTGTREKDVYGTETLE